MQTKCIKLVSGEEILTEVLSESSDIIYIKNPVVMIMAREGQLAIVPWLPLAEKQECSIKKSDIILSYIPKQDLVNHYKQQTGGIVTAPAGVLNRLERPF